MPLQEITRVEFCALDPLKMPPNGDRYLVEKIHVGQFHPVEGGYEIELADVGKRDEKGNELPGEDAEGKRGFFLAVVCSKGNGHRLENDVTVPMFYEPGDVVVCERYTGRELVLGKGTYRIVSQVDVLAKVEQLSPWEWDETELIASNGKAHAS